MLKKILTICLLFANVFVRATDLAKPKRLPRRADLVIKIAIDDERANIVRNAAIIDRLDAYNRSLLERCMLDPVFVETNKFLSGIPVDNKFLCKCPADVCKMERTRHGDFTQGRVFGYFRGDEEK